MVKLVGIYRIINIDNNKVYIGSSTNINKRIKTHIYKLNGNEHWNTHLQASYNKEKGNFKFEIVELCEEQHMIDKEQIWINYFNSNDNKYGYNRKGAGWSGKHSEETKLKIKEKRSTQIMKPMKQETKDKIGLANRTSPKKIGHKHTQETKDKIRNIHSGRKISEKSRMILRNNSLEQARKLKEDLEYRKLHSEKLSKAFKGRIFSENHKAAMSKSSMGKKWINNGIENKRVEKYEYENLIKLGWKQGMIRRVYS